MLQPSRPHPDTFHPQRWLPQRSTQPGSCFLAFLLSLKPGAPYLDSEMWASSKARPLSIAATEQMDPQPGAPYLDFEMWVSSEARPLSIAATEQVDSPSRVPHISILRCGYRAEARPPSYREQTGCPIFGAHLRLRWDIYTVHSAWCPYLDSEMWASSEARPLSIP